MLKDRLVDTRIKRGYTQEEMGELIGYPKLQVSRWENGKNAPSSEALAKIARALDVSADYLLGLTNDWTPSLAQSDLSPKERTIVSMVRQGDKLSAIEIIMSGE
jgi:transcriptional regulator with XRE-family HTH domain